MNGVAVAPPPPLDDEQEASPPGRTRRALAQLLLLVAVLVALGVFLVVAVFPTRLWLDRREAVDEARAELAALEAEQAELEERAAELRDPDAVELTAREQFLLTRPDEELFVVRPPEAPGPELPVGWPFPGVAHLLGAE